MGEKVADFLLRRLREWDVEHVFGYAGDGAARVDFDDPQRRDQIKETFYGDIDDRTADAATPVTELDSSHSPFLSQPAALAGAVSALTSLRRVA